MNYIENLLTFFKHPEVVALLTAILIWTLNEWSKRREVRYRRKQENYEELLKNLVGFYENTQDSNKKNEFIAQYRKAFLFCPTDVIEKINNFFDTVKVESGSSNSKKENALEELVQAMRDDLNKMFLFRRFGYRKAKFKHYTSS